MSDNLGTHMDAAALRVAEIHGGRVMGMPNFTGVLIRVTEVVTGTTVFKAEVLENMGQALGSVTLDDLFNAGWKIKGIKCTTAGNVGLVRDVTDFVTATGTVTTAAMSGTYTVGDILALAPDEILTPGGKPISVEKTLAAINTAGNDITAVSTGGDIHIEEISVQKITAAETANALSGIVITSDDTVKLNQKVTTLANEDLVKAKLSLGDRYTMKINHVLAEGKKLTIKSTGENADVASYRITVRGTALKTGAALTPAV